MECKNVFRSLHKIKEERLFVHPFEQQQQQQQHKYIK